MRFWRGIGYKPMVGRGEEEDDKDEGTNTWGKFFHSILNTNINL